MTKYMLRKCFFPGCENDALAAVSGREPSKFCKEHHNAANAWLTAQKRLDADDELRYWVESTDGSDGRLSVAEELAAVGWDDPDEIGDEAA